MAVSLDKKIHRHMTIQDIFTEFPHRSQKLAHELTSRGLQCVGCQAATYETLEAGAMGHGMTSQEVDQLVDCLNTIVLENTDHETITMTPRAAEKYLQILDSEGKEGWGIRFMEKPGGCGGLEFSLDYSKHALDTDLTFESQGIEIHIHQDLVSRFMGTELDYLDGLHGSGFKFSNPNVSSSCACGASHTY